MPMTTPTTASVERFAPVPAAGEMVGALAASTVTVGSGVEEAACGVEDAACDVEDAACDIEDACDVVDEDVKLDADTAPAAFQVCTGLLASIVQLTRSLRVVPHGGL